MDKRVSGERGCRGKAGLLGKGMGVPESLRKEAWPCLGVPSLRGDTVLLFLGGWISGTPSGLSLEAASVLSLLRPSSPSGQDCENYITLLEKQGQGLLICGTNARRPSCWTLVRGPLPFAQSGWASAPPGGIEVGGS